MNQTCLCSIATLYPTRTHENLLTICLVLTLSASISTATCIIGWGVPAINQVMKTIILGINLVLGFATDSGNN